MNDQLSPQLTNQFDQIWGTKTPTAAVATGRPVSSRANEIRSLAGATNQPTTDNTGESNAPILPTSSGKESLVGSMLKPVVGFGHSIAAGASGVLPDSATGVSDIQKSNQATADDSVKLIQLIRDREAKGMDTAALKTALKNEVSPTQYDKLFPSINKTNEQVLGEAVGTGVAALSGGALSGGEAALGGDLAGALGTGAKVGGSFGAASGASQAMQNNESIGDVAKSAAIGGTEGAALGAVTGGLVHGAGSLASGKAAQAASEAGSKIKSLPSKLFGQDIPEQVQSALKETSGKTFDTYAKVAQDASKSFKNQTPLEYAGTRAQEALDTIQRKLDNLGSTKSSIVQQAGVGDKPVGSIVTKFRQELKNFVSKNTIHGPGELIEPPSRVDTATKLPIVEYDKTPIQYQKGSSASLVDGDSKLLNNLQSKARVLGNNPTASDVDKFIDYAQDYLYTAGRDLTLPITDQTTSEVRNMIGSLNNDLKAQLPESYRNLNQKYADLVQTRNELNTKLGKEGEKGGALMKRVFSPSDANTKKLFADVKTHTGIDLVNEATLARYVMETMGDSRQASMLQQLNLPKMSPKGMLQFATDLATKKFNTPERILARARELTADSQFREASLSSKNQANAQTTPTTRPMTGKNAVNTIQPKSNNIPKKPTTIAEKLQGKQNFQKGAIKIPTFAKGMSAQEIPKSVIKKIPAEIRQDALDAYTNLSGLNSGGNMMIENAINDYKVKVQTGTVTKSDIRDANEIHFMVKGRKEYD